MMNKGVTCKFTLFIIVGITLFFMFFTEIHKKQTFYKNTNNRMFAFKTNFSHIRFISSETNVKISKFVRNLLHVGMLKFTTDI